MASQAARAARADHRLFHPRFQAVAVSGHFGFRAALSCFGPLGPFFQTFGFNISIERKKGAQDMGKAMRKEREQVVEAVDWADQLGAAIAPRPGKRQPAGIWPLVCWAFQRELANVVFDEMQREVFTRSYGMEYVMMRQAELGCRVDGGGRSDPHTDADLIASALGVLPEGVGGRGSALLIAETARAGSPPDWVPDPVARCEPVEWKNGKHGRFAAREYWTGAGRWPATWLGRDHGYACPVYFADTPSQVARYRRTYLQWWGALRELRNGLRLDQPLTCFDVTLDMPPMRPWAKGD